MVIINAQNKEINMEIRLSKTKLFSKNCYSLVCSNRNSRK